MNSRERYEDTLSVVSYEADSTGRLSLYALFNWFQDIAGKHAAFLRVGYNELRDANLAWVLSRIKVEVHSFPRWGDTVHLAT